jgi:hypothetical protein
MIAPLSALEVLESFDPKSALELTKAFDRRKLTSRMLIDAWLLRAYRTALSGVNGEAFEMRIFEPGLEELPDKTPAGVPYADIFGPAVKEFRKLEFEITVEEPEYSVYLSWPAATKRPAYQFTALLPQKITGERLHEIGQAVDVRFVTEDDFYHIALVWGTWAATEGFIGAAFNLDEVFHQRGQRIEHNQSGFSFASMVPKVEKKLKTRGLTVGSHSGYDLSFRW